MTTITQQWAKAVDTLKEQYPDLTIVDCGRGRSSYHVAHSAVVTVARLQKHVESGEPFLYGTCPTGEPEPKKRCAEAAHRWFPYDNLSKDRVAFFPGAQYGIYALVRAWMAQAKPEEQANVYVQWPGYANYGVLTDEARRGAERDRTHTHFERLDVTNQHEISGAQIAALPQEKNLVILTIPSNPQGAVPTIDGQRDIIRNVVAHKDLTLVLDESFIESDFREGHPARFQSLLHEAGEMVKDGSLSQEQLDVLLNKTAVIRSGSKAAGMAGERPNMIILPNDPELIHGVDSVTSVLIGNTPYTTQQLMADYFCSIDIPQMEKMATYYKKHRDVVMERMQAEGIPTTEPESGFFLVVDLHDLIGKPVPAAMRSRLPRGLDFSVIENDEQIAQLLLYAGSGKERLGVLPANMFGYAPEDGKVRLCYGPHKALLETACSVIESVHAQVLNKFVQQDKSKEVIV